MTPTWGPCPQVALAARVALAALVVPEVLAAMAVPEVPVVLAAPERACLQCRTWAPRMMRWKSTLTGCTLNGDYHQRSGRGSRDDPGPLRTASSPAPFPPARLVHTQGEPEESKWWLIGLVDDTLEPVEKDKGTKAESSMRFPSGSVRQDLLSGRTDHCRGRKDPGCWRVKTLSMTVDGKETAIVPGTYTGKIVLTVALS